MDFYHSRNLFFCILKFMPMRTFTNLLRVKPFWSFVKKYFYCIFICYEYFNLLLNHKISKFEWFFGFVRWWFDGMAMRRFLTVVRVGWGDGLSDDWSVVGRVGRVDWCMVGTSIGSWAVVGNWVSDGGGSISVWWDNLGDWGDDLNFGDGNNSSWIMTKFSP